MNALSSLSATGLSSAITPAELASEPESVRRGGAAAKQAYETGLGFQSMLVDQLAQQLTSTLSDTTSGSDGLGGDSGDGSDSSDGGSALGSYSSLLTSALTQGVTTGDQTGIAMQIARSIDPRLGLTTR